jgi:hypothetical protein
MMHLIAPKLHIINEERNQNMLIDYPNESETLSLALHHIVMGRIFSPHASRVRVLG